MPRRRRAPALPVRGERNWLIWFARTDGWTCAALAREFKISPGRVHQIEQAVQRRIADTFEWYLEGMGPRADPVAGLISL